MWRETDREWPAWDDQVVGVVVRDGGFDELGWWTRTSDGWYVSDTRGNLGNRDAMRKEDSKGPHLWCHAPLRR